MAPTRPKRDSAKQGEDGTKAIEAAAQEAVDFFLLSIRDPHNIRHCGRCLYGTLLTFTASPDLQYSTERLTTSEILKNQAFWDHLLRFMVMKRTDKQLDRLLTRFSQCSCKLDEKNIKNYHDIAEVAEPGTISRAYMSTYAPEEKRHMYTTERCAVVIKIFCVLYSILFDSGVKSVAKGVGRRWPRTAADLVPFGPDDLIQTLLQWYRFVPDPIIFSLIGAIVRICRFLVAPSMIKFEVIGLAIESTKTVVDITIGSLKRNLKHLKGEALLEAYSMRVFKYEFQARGFANYLEALETLPLDTRCALIRGHETKAMQLCSMMVYLSDDIRFETVPLPNLKSNPLCFAKHTQWLFRFFHMYLYPRPNMPVHPSVLKIDKTEFPPPASVRSTEEMAIHYIGYFQKEQRCSAYQCQNSLQSAGKAFQRCGRCNIAPYCSRECQVKAWREEYHPHKRVCPILRTLIVAGGGPGMFFPVPNPPPIVRLMGITTNFYPLRPYVLQNWKDSGISEDDLLCVAQWGKIHDSTQTMPNGTEWNPGYDDYVAVMEGLSRPIGPGRKLCLLDRLAKWPSEVAKEKQHLELQAFWDEEIE